MRMAHRQGGFTLMELAVVLVIVALLIGGMLLPLSAQNDLRFANETQKTLNDIRDALVGFAAANGRLPCPAQAGTSGIEASSGTPGNCTNPYDGLVPAITLGIGPTDGNGFAVDAWGNQIHYAVYPTSIGGQANPFTAPNGMRLATMSSIAATSPLLSVCACGNAVTGGGTTAAACGGTCPGLTTGRVTDQAVAVVYSLGKNASVGGAGAGESHNPNPNATVAADPAFVWHTPTQSGAADGEFDDLMIWISPNILYNRMVAAGQLP